ncbi:unnamed protein product [Spodoptera exigua]|nr:unnamed protein product [Spodoptera exigua]
MGRLDRSDTTASQETGDGKRADGLPDGEQSASPMDTRNKEGVTKEILKKSSKMFSAYEDDLENGKLVQFPELLKTDVATVIDSKKQEALNNSLESWFPNLEIALRIYYLS